MDMLYVVMPAYSEEENIEKTIRQWYPVVEAHNGGGKSKLVIFNDGSKNKALEKGQLLMQELPLLEVRDKTNSGHGPTVIMAYGYAISQGADYIFQTDSDGQTNPDEFEAFWNVRGKYICEKTAEGLQSSKYHADYIFRFLQVKNLLQRDFHYTLCSCFA